MTRQTSTYLDLIRFAAALIVFIGHTSGQRLTGGWLWQAGPFMSEAVTIFFVLSGYVIAFVTDKGESTGRAFIVARAARIYSVALPALVITFVADSFGRHFNPDAYSISWGYRSDDQAWQFFANALFINRLWFNDISPGSDLPFWSLGYEVWYYVIFALCIFLTGWRRILAVVLTFAVVGPQIAAMFPIWLIGVGCYRLSRRWRMGSVTALLLCLGCLAAWVGYEAGSIRYGQLTGLVSPLFGRPELAQDYLVAGLFAGHLLGFNALARTFTVPDRAALFIRWIAGATFSLYLFHLPVVQFLAAVSPWPLSSAPNRILEFGGGLVIIFLLAELTERRKAIWRTALTRIADMILPAPDSRRLPSNR
ncbi:MAG: acyltransferase [Rhodopila sp.]